jgi:hypothetical protein
MVVGERSVDGFDIDSPDRSRDDCDECMADSSRPRYYDLSLGLERMLADRHTGDLVSETAEQLASQIYAAAVPVFVTRIGEENATGDDLSVIWQMIICAVIAR